MGKTTIEWTATQRPDGTWAPGYTFNPWWGCVKVSPGCEHCYAETLARRYGHTVWGPAKTTARRTFGPKHWAEPLKWDAQAKKDGVRRRVFCASMADVFEDHPQIVDERRRLFDLISDTPNLDWLLLTKRPENILPMLIAAGRGFQDLPPWVWIGTSVENQEQADKRIPELLKVPAAVRFLSCEPLLGPVEFSDVSRRSDAVRILGKPALSGIHWIIAGGESGPGARPMHPDWARSLRDQCQAAGVAFFFKQWGEYWPAGHRIVEGRAMVLCGDEALYRVGKKAAGRELDGREWNQFPETVPV